MSDIAIPVIVLSQNRDDVEFYNKTLRDAGHAVRCRGLTRLEDLGSALESDSPHLLVFFAAGHPADIGDVARIREIHAPMTRLLVIGSSADETAIGNALRAGAEDLVSAAHTSRICAVSEREIRSFRTERSLEAALHSAMQYKKQLKSMLSNSADAIAIAQEGIVVEANQAWADLFTLSDIDASLGPLMDHFAGGSQARLKTALVACSRGKRERSTVKVDGKSSDDQVFAANLTLEATTHDGEPAVHLSIERDRLIDAEAVSDAIVEQTLHTDLATGFLQRRHFLELLGEKIEHNPQQRTRALAFIRPDGFEEIERDLGPVSSEEIIGQIAGTLDPLMDEADLGGRYAGKVVALVIERDSLSDIQSWIESVLVRISDRLFEVADRSLALTCSAGLAEIGAASERVEDLIRSAERALERAGSDGGNRSSLEESTDESIQIKRIDEVRVRQIKAAFVEGRFRLKHFSIANLSGQSERIFDTYVRMVDEQGDEIAGNEFMESAERNGMLRPVDRWVIDASLDFCSNHACDLVFVKLSHESVLDTTLWGWIEERTSSAGVKPERLCFQVTEDSASKYQKQTRALAECLRRRGFRFAIENFGSGRDPLRLLASTPVDFVKFDGALSTKLTSDTALQEKVRRLVAGATHQGIRTIATQVENANTMALLFQLGIGYMQGHYLHEPEVVLEAAG